jgi:hypothetical protein
MAHVFLSPPIKFNAFVDGSMRIAAPKFIEFDLCRRELIFRVGSRILPINVKLRKRITFLPAHVWWLSLWQKWSCFSLAMEQKTLARARCADLGFIPFVELYRQSSRL